MVLEDIKEMWSEKPKNKNGKSKKKNAKAVAREERFIPKLFVRGDSIVLVCESK